MANTYKFTGAPGGLWSLNTNWTRTVGVSGTHPVSGDTADLNGRGVYVTGSNVDDVTIINSTGTGSLFGMSSGGLAVSGGTLVVVNGTLLVASGSSLYVGVGGTLTVHDGDLALVSGSYLYVHDNGILYMYASLLLNGGHLTISNNSTLNLAGLGISVKYSHLTLANGSTLTAYSGVIVDPSTIGLEASIFLPDTTLPPLLSNSLIISLHTEPRAALSAVAVAYHNGIKVSCATGYIQASASTTDYDYAIIADFSSLYPPLTAGDSLDLYVEVTTGTKVIGKWYRTSYQPAVVIPASVTLTAGQSIAASNIPATVTLTAGQSIAASNMVSVSGLSTLTESQVKDQVTAALAATINPTTDTNSPLYVQTGSVAGIVKANLDASVEAIQDTVDEILAGGNPIGPGGTPFTVTVQDTINHSPLSGVSVWVTSDLAGTTTIAGTLTTDALGKVVFMLPTGTAYVWRMSPTYTFPNPQAITVT